MESKAHAQMGNYGFALLLLFLSYVQPSFASTQVVYGPVTYLRDGDQPVTVVDTFQLLNVEGAFTLVVENGDPTTGTDRVTSALVSLNGDPIAGPSDFKKKVDKLEKRVQLQSTNELSVQLRGDPGTYITISIVGEYPNRPPLADAGTDQTVHVGKTVQLEGSASTDPDGDSLTFRWALIEAPANSVAALNDPLVSNPTFVADVAGTYRIELVVNDGALESAPDTVTVTTVNSPPIADAGPDQTVFVQETVHLDGSNSTDVDGDELTFAWRLVYLPDGSTAALSDPGAVQPSFTVDLPGSYVAELTVNDGTEISEPATITVTTMNSPPAADAGPDQTAYVTNVVTLDGRGSSDVDGDLLHFTWALTSIPNSSDAVLSDPNVVQPKFEIDQFGRYIAQLIVNDGTVDSAADTTTITTLNTRPVAEAGPDQTVFVTDTVQLDGSGSSDVDGDSLRFTWSFVARPAGSTAALSDIAAVKPTFPVDLPGVYVVQLQVQDSELDSHVDTVTITTQNSPPVADAGPDQTVFVTNTVQLDGAGSWDADSDPLDFSWSFTSVPAGSLADLSNSSVANPSFYVDLPGMYVTQLMVNDGTVDSAPDTVTITTLNSAPVADAGPDQTVYVGDTVTLDGSGSTDADGNPLTFDWSLIFTPDGNLVDLLNADTVTPSFVPEQAGDYVGQLIVNDGEVNSPPDTMTVTAEIYIPPNQAPVITSSPVTEGVAGEAYTYDVDADDPDTGDVLVFSLSIGPPGMSIDSATGLLEWTPAIADVGTHNVEVRVEDQAGLFDTDRFVLVIAKPSNRAPTITSTPVTAATAAQLYQYDVEATDPDSGDVVLFSLATAPTGMSIDETTGLIIWTPTIDQIGEHPVTIRAEDQEGLFDEQSFTVTVADVETGPLPPDPATVAPPLDPTVSTTLVDASEFLYTGDNPIQTGVAPGTIEERRAAVIRGQVFDRGGNPLSGVTITILDHPELGQTLSRADGAFDLAVNGGGILTLDYEKSGYLPAQRQVRAPWQDYAYVLNVTLVGLDPVVTTVDLTAPTGIQVARGSESTDADGSRRATLFFTPGTTAEMVLPDGSTQPLVSLGVRATEYTIGSGGPQAMPAELPPTSGYTYALEISADQALAAGATSVVLSQPIPFYVENFLDFPVGSVVPAGYYDRQKGQWIPSLNGRVIQVLGSSSGLADLDTEGDGIADTAEVVAALGIDDAERAKLAELYGPGQTLWRVPMDHFTPWDCNWPYGPYGPPVGGEAPKNSEGEPATPNVPPCNVDGSTIGCETQTLGEAVSVAGTPFHLHYQSERSPGYKARRTLNINLTDATVPEGLKRVQLTIVVAGQRFEQTFPPTPSQRVSYTWDGFDAFGRPVAGYHKATVTVGYVYDAVYYAARDEYQQSFALVSGTRSRISGLRESMEIIFEQRSYVDVVSTSPNDLPIAGWSLSARHRWDPVHGVLIRGDGSEHRGSTFAVISTAAGTGVRGFTGDGGPATEARLWPGSLTVGPDGSFYIADVTHRVRRVDPNGIITTVAGTGVRGFSGDGGPATAADLYSPQGLSIGPDGSLYIGDAGNSRVRRVDPNGIITTVAGTGVLGFSGDGGPATAADLYNPSSLSFGPDGGLYIVDSGNKRVRRIGTDGIITTVVGDGILNQPTGLSIGPDGSLYIADRERHHVRRVGPDGTIITVAGSGSPYFSGDGGPATDAGLVYPTGVSIGPDGSLYIADQGTRRVRQVDPNGIIVTIAGGGSGLSDDGGPAAATYLSNPLDVAVAPNGNLLISADYRIRRVHGSGDRFLFVPSADGAEVYEFDFSGRHARTLDALTGGTLHEFGYDAEGRLISVTDGSGNLTTIERNASGNTTAIVSPYGQRTEFTLAANGYIASIANPASETYRIEYTADGLLTRFEDPRGHASTMTYDALGRLVQDANAAGGSQNLTRADLENPPGTEVTVATAEGAATAYRVEDLPIGSQQRTVTAPDGTTTVAVTGADGKTTRSGPDDTVSETVAGPDPRFGMAAPVTTRQTVTTPGGRVLTLTQARTADLTDLEHPLSLVTLTDTVTVNGRTSTSVYDAATRTTTSTSAAGRQSITTMDALRRPVAMQILGIDPVNAAYDTRGRLSTITQGSGVDERLYVFSYNAEGYLSSITDPLNRISGYEYDAAGRITRETFPDGRVTTYTYDANGNLTSVTPPGRPAHVFTHTQVDLTDEYTAPNVGANSTITYTYNLDKQLTRFTRPDGQVLNLNYDASGRLSSISLPRGQISYAYNAATGGLSGITAPDGSSLAYTYDGLLPLSTSWTGPVTGSVSTTYNNDFQVSSRAVNGASTVAFAYNNDDLVIQAGVLALTYDTQNDQITGTTLGTITTGFGYNAFGEVASHNATSNSSGLYSAQYIRDKLDRITQKVENMGGTTKTTAYTYDTAGQLVGVTEDGTVLAQYQYDENGNRLSRTTPSGTLVGTYDDQDRMLSYGDFTYAYTANGELQSKTNTGSGDTTAYNYDLLGNLMDATLPDGTRVDYLIDGQNRRIGKKVNDVLVQGFLYKDQLNPIAELDGSGNLVSRFVYATKSNVPDYMERGGNTYRIISDHLGSPRLVVNTTNGTVVQQIDYGEFGNVLVDTNPGFQPFGFAGGLYDQDTQLTRFGFRDYDAYSGRWTTKDPILFESGVFNVYGYIANDPVNFIDTFGLQAYKKLRKILRIGVPLVVFVGTTVAFASPVGWGWAAAIGGASAVGGFIYFDTAFDIILDTQVDFFENWSNQDYKNELCPLPK